MLKILQAMLQQCMNRELPNVEAGFRKGKGSRDQIANICWIIEKAREFQKNIYWPARRSNQSILKEISPEYSMEGLMLKLKLLYFGHLM